MYAGLDGVSWEGIHGRFRGGRRFLCRWEDCWWGKRDGVCRDILNGLLMVDIVHSRLVRGRCLVVPWYPWMVQLALQVMVAVVPEESC